MLYLIAVVCPPFAALIAGDRRKAVMNLLLTFCFWVPGVIHAFIVIKEAEQKHEEDHFVEKDRRESSYSLPRVGQSAAPQSR